LLHCSWHIFLSGFPIPFVNLQIHIAILLHVAWH
jgi:hypothetical protein